MNSPLTAYLACKKLYQTFVAKKVRVDITKETISPYSYSEESLAEKGDFVPQKFTVLDSDIFTDLSPAACKLVLRIIKELNAYSCHAHPLFLHVDPPLGGGNNLKSFLIFKSTNGY